MSLDAVLARDVGTRSHPAHWSHAQGLHGSSIGNVCDRWPSPLEDGTVGYRQRDLDTVTVFCWCERTTFEVSVTDLPDWPGVCGDRLCDPASHAPGQRRVIRSNSWWAQ